jgi:hypothetical protein
MPIYTPGKLVLKKESQTLDADAEAYVNAVEVADGQRIEDPVRFAINDFVIGCKSDGIWTAIKASCILAGARTLTGALVPLVGTAPTNVSFVSGDYNRETGLVGDGSTKSLNSNRNNNADPQNSNHNAVFINTIGTSVALGTADGGAVVGNNLIGGSLVTNRDSTTTYSAPIATGFNGINRNAAASFISRKSSADTSIASASQAPASSDVWLFRNASFYGTHRLAFYSIGESLDLALLDTRVTALINAFAAAIP